MGFPHIVPLQFGFDGEHDRSLRVKWLAAIVGWGPSGEDAYRAIGVRRIECPLGTIRFNEEEFVLVDRVNFIGRFDGKLPRENVKHLFLLFVVMVLQRHLLSRFDCVQPKTEVV